MQVKFTRTIPGGEERGFVEGREHDWPMQTISKLRADYGQDILVVTGNVGDQIERQRQRQENRLGKKLNRQQRLQAAGLMPTEEPEEEEPEPEVAEDVEEVEEADAVETAAAGEAAPEEEQAPRPRRKRRPGRPRKKEAPAAE